MRLEKRDSARLTKGSHTITTEKQITLKKIP